MPQHWGTFQRFTYDGLVQELTLADHHFTFQVADSPLEYVGYDRWYLPDTRVTPFTAYSGYTHFEGLAYPSPHQFSWRLQNLTPEVYYKLSAIARRSYAAKQPVQLQDGLLVYDEVLPRTRARVGSYLEQLNGIVYYYPIFNIVLEMERPRLRGQLFSLEMKAVEFNPRSPVPVTSDIP